MMRLAARVGERSPVHATALGKVMAAGLEVDRVKAILKGEGMPALTPRTITSVAGYLTELKAVAAQGFAVDDLEAQSDGRCVAVALKGLPFLCGLSVSAPANRLPQEAVLSTVKLLQKSAAAIVKDFRSYPA